MFVTGSHSNTVCTRVVLSQIPSHFSQVCISLKFPPGDIFAQNWTQNPLMYSGVSNNRTVLNKRIGRKTAEKKINVQEGINVHGGFFYSVFINTLKMCS